jgi:hypothetical protein
LYYLPILLSLPLAAKYFLKCFVLKLNNYPPQINKKKKRKMRERQTDRKEGRKKE